MNPEKLFGVPKGIAHGIIIVLLGLCLSAVSDIFFQTLSRPYWIDSEDAPTATQRFHTISIVNPGPWSTRFPVIEFLKPLKIEFVDWSPSVTWDDKMPNMVTVSTQKGIPAGGMFFITYSYASTNIDRLPKIMCDGKECKYAPSIDVDTMLRILLLIQGILVILTITIAVLYLKTDKLLLAEKANAINAALLLLAKQKGEEDVTESARAVDDLHVPSAARPKTVKSNGKNPKKQPPPPPPTDT